MTIRPVRKERSILAERSCLQDQHGDAAPDVQLAAGRKAAVRKFAFDDAGRTRNADRTADAEAVKTCRAAVVAVHQVLDRENAGADSRRIVFLVNFAQIDSGLEIFDVILQLLAVLFEDPLQLRADRASWMGFTEILKFLISCSWLWMTL